MISYFMLIHIGSSEGVTLLEFEEEMEENQETPQPAAPKDEDQILRNFWSALTTDPLLS